MKKRFRARLLQAATLVLLASAFCSSNCAAAEYDIKEFDGPNGLINHEPAFVSGDILQLRNDIKATSDIGELTEGNLVISGDDFAIDGMGKYSGIYMGSKIYNYTINNIEFKNFNKSTTADFARGSVIYNAENGESKVVNGILNNNESIASDGYAQGGAIYNKGTTGSAVLRIVNSSFDGNKTYSGNVAKAENGGGAIFNSGNTKLTIIDTVFKNNEAKAYTYSYGGAIANVGVRGDKTVIQFSNLIFDNNSSVSENDTGYGGAFYNNAQTKTDSYIIDSSFINNKARGVWARGGAIYNDNLGSGMINNSIFRGNSAVGSRNETTGGAFDNKSKQLVIIRNCIFENNYVESPTSAYGGAIYNSGIITLYADEGFMSFKGNYSNSRGVTTSNAIYNTGTVNLSVTKSGMVSIEDKIAGANRTSSIININKMGATTIEETERAVSVPDEGNIVVLETISNHTVNLYNGIFSLGRSDQNVVPDGNYFNNVNLNLYNGLFNLANGAIDKLSVVDMTSQENAQMYIDADLAGGKSDSITITGNSSGKVNIIGVNIISNIDSEITLAVFNNSNISLDDLSLNIYNQNKKYDVTGSNGKLTFTPTAGIAGLGGAVGDTVAQYRSFSAHMAEEVQADLGQMQGTDAVVTIFGDLNNINGNRYAGMTVGDGQSLNIFSAGNVDANSNVDASINNFVKIKTGENVKGGFIENNGLTNVFSSVFDSNKVIANDDVSKAMGGAIYNSKDLSLSYSMFNANKAQGGLEAAGGAVHNDGGNASLIFVRFNDNSAVSADGAAKGGAIYNNGEMTIINSAFENNSVTGKDAQGGAIYNAGTMSLIASNTDFYINGNTANGKSNGIYNEGVLNMNAGQGNKIVINDAVQGKDKAVININFSSNDLDGRPCQGEIQFNNTVSGSTLNFYNGILTPSFERNLDGNDLKLGGGLLNFVNNYIGTMSLDKLTVSDTSRWNLELDLQNKTGDKILANSVSGDGILSITNVILLSDTLDKDFFINIAGEGVRDRVNLIARVAYTPIFQYKLFYDQPTGSIGIGNRPEAPIERFNPAIMAAPIAAQIGGYLTQLNSYQQAFNNMDMYMIMPRAQREALKYANKIANAPVDGGIYSPLALKEKDSALWFKPYSNFENVPLHNGYKVSNISYGSLFGGDSDLKQLKHGVEAMYSIYGGYNGSTQHYQGIRINQNGGLGGATAMFYKGNFFSGLTANVGANSGEATTMYGLDNFTMLTAGVASKTGYNWELFKSKVIVQPSYQMSYTFVNTFDYTNAAGVRLSSDPLNAIQISPGIRIIGNLKNGWQPYIGVNMVWNIMDNTKFRANDVSLPELSVKPFVEYGVGVQKHWGSRFTGFAQAMVRSGGREGIGFQFGFRWRI